jgi:hypothetical protein
MFASARAMMCSLPTRPAEYRHGTVDAGDGIDTLRYLFLEDTILDSGMALPATFENMGHGWAEVPRRHWGWTSGRPAMIAVGGGDRYYYNPENRFINRGLIDTNGPALVSDNGATGGLTASNEGRIRARLISTISSRLTWTTSPISAIPRYLGNWRWRGPHYRGDAFANSGDILADGTAVITTIALANSARSAPPLD